MKTAPIQLDAHGHTDVGRKRERNEDQFLVSTLSKSLLVEQTSLQLDDRTRLHGAVQGSLMLVADGVGGHEGGEVASRIAVEAIVRFALNTMPWFFGLDHAREDDLVAVLGAAIERSEAAVCEEQERASLPRMGTTMTMAYVLWPLLYLVHAGDSRAYLLREGELRQLSRDHTLAQLLSDQAGESHGEDTFQGRVGDVLVNAVGADGNRVRPEVSKHRLVPDDRLLLCTDGLTKHLSDDEILSVLAETGDAATASQRLVDEANRAGGSDNITAVVARFAPLTAADGPE